MNIKRALIIDGSYMIHRALHVPEIYDLKNSNGKRTGGIFQFMRSMAFEIKNFKDGNYYPIVTFDAGLSNRRIAIYPNYKKRLDKKTLDEDFRQNGDSWDEDIKKKYLEDQEYVMEYRTQRGDVIGILQKLGIPILMFDGWEGDDLIYICSKLIPESVIVTDDKDLQQLLAPNVKVRRPRKGDTIEYETYQKTANDPDMRKFVIEKAISGDASDNIPQAAQGVGAKTAKLIADIMVEHPDSWMEDIAESKNRYVKKFLDEEKNPDAIKIFNRNMELVDLSRVEITDSIRELISAEIAGAKKPDFLAIAPKLAEFEIKEVDPNELVTLINGLYKNLIS